MTRLMIYLDQAIPSAGLAMAALQGLLVRATYVGLAGVAIELFGRIALTAFHAAVVHHQARQYD